MENPKVMSEIIEGRIVKHSLLRLFVKREKGYAIVELSTDLLATQSECPTFRIKDYQRLKSINFTRNNYPISCDSHLISIYLPKDLIEQQLPCSLLLHIS